MNDLTILTTSVTPVGELLPSPDRLTHTAVPHVFLKIRHMTHQVSDSIDGLEVIGIESKMIKSQYRLVQISQAQTRNLKLCLELVYLQSIAASEFFEDNRINIRFVSIF